MVGRGVALPPVRAGQGADQEAVVALLDGAGQIVVEALRPLGRRAVAAAHAQHRVAQVVGQVAAPEDQDPLVAQRAQGAAEREVLHRRLVRVDRQLHHRHVVIREQVQEHAPAPVIEAPVGAQPGVRSEQRRRPRRQLGRSRRRVLQLVERLGEAAKVVDGLGRALAGERRLLDEPVRRDAEHRARLCEALAERAEAAAPGVVVERVHRRAVADEEDRLPRGRAAHRVSPRCSGCRSHPR